jgi:hypothetical protein
VGRSVRGQPAADLGDASVLDADVERPAERAGLVKHLRVAQYEPVHVGGD